MKKLQLLVVALFATTLAFAQPEKGNIFLNGSLNFDIGSPSADVSNFNLGITPKVGYFVSDNIVVGLDLGFAMANSKDESGPDEVKTNGLSFGGGAFARYYMMPADHFAMFFEGGLNTSFGSSSVETAGNSVDGPSTFALNAGITPGMSIYVSKKIALEANYGFLGYTTSSSEIGGVKTSQGNFGLNLNPNTIRLGVSVLF
ncbi:porin family protein [Chitinophagales bacterium]|jgi:outer membrane protein|nr:porin family protein [Chitinophagales bacterium]|tara:strand:- start:1446 stop:2048 length:603 start_codon:yes stop_codon:yes gene_type:complete